MSFNLAALENAIGKVESVLPSVDKLLADVMELEAFVPVPATVKTGLADLRTVLTWLSSIKVK